MELWELIARECIRDRVARYNQAGDSGRYQEMVECFAADGVLSIVGGSEYEGHAAMVEFFSAVRGTARPGLTQVRHCVTNLCIDVEAPTVAAAQSYFQVITDIGLDHWGRYRDRFVVVGDRWLLAARSVKTDGYAAASFFR